jgi:hypothetical protein
MFSEIYTVDAAAPATKTHRQQTVVTIRFMVHFPPEAQFTSLTDDSQVNSPGFGQSTRLRVGISLRK